MPFENLNAFHRFQIPNTYGVVIRARKQVSATDSNAIDGSTVRSELGGELERLEIPNLNHVLKTAGKKQRADNSNAVNALTDAVGRNRANKLESRSVPNLSNK